MTCSQPCQMSRHSETTSYGLTRTQRLTSISRYTKSQLSYERTSLQFWQYSNKSLNTLNNPICLPMFSEMDRNAVIRTSLLLLPSPFDNILSRSKTRSHLSFHRFQDSDENASPAEHVHREGSKTMNPEPLIENLDAVSLCLVVDDGCEFPGNRRYERKVSSAKERPCSIPFR